MGILPRMTSLHLVLYLGKGGGVAIRIQEEKKTHEKKPRNFIFEVLAVLF